MMTVGGIRSMLWCQSVIWLLNCFQMKLMSLKDERMKVMNEVLSGVKVLIHMLNIFTALTAGHHHHHHILFE